MPEELYDRILHEVFEAAEQGRELTAVELLARHPAHAETVQRALEAASRYRRASARLAPRKPLLIEALGAGDRLGDFEVEAPLARGGMGCVYVARQGSLGGRRVALKVLPLESASAHGAARFEREALTLAGLHHPHLAEVYGVGSTGGALYFAMRLVEGPTLRDVLDRRVQRRRAGKADEPAERRALIERLAEVADALAAVHGAGLVHRDVKPSNVVLEGGDAADAHAVLVDFGLARPVDSNSLTLSGESPATPSYAPPEQMLGREVDARADVFSLGVTLHDLLAARQPTERLQASAGLEPLSQLVPGLDPDLVAIVARAVDPDPQWRYTHGGEVRDDLRAWLAGEPVGARSMPWGEKARRWLGRHPKRIAQVALLVAAVVIVVVAFSLGPGAEIQNLRAVGAALDRGDLREFARAERELDGWAPIGLLLTDEQAAAVERVRRASPGDLLTRAIAALDSNDTEGGFVAAATAIGTRDGPEDALLEHYFLACETDDALRARLRAEQLDLWAILIGRAMYENPIDEPARAARMRAAVLHAWARNDLSTTARAYLLTALGGVGTAEDLLDPLLAWTADPARTFEDVRIGARNTERVVRRVHARGASATIRFDDVWRAIRPVALRLRDVDANSRPFAVAPVVADLCTALALAQRAAGLEPKLPEEFLPVRPWNELRDESVPYLAPWFPLIAVTGSRDLIDVILAPEPDVLKSMSPKQLGRVSALLPIELESSTNLVHLLEVRRGPQSTPEFENGRTSGLAELIGVKPEEVLDSDTLFGFRPRDSSLRAITGLRSDLPKLIEVVDGAPPEHLGWNSLAWLGYAPTEGMWWFTNDGARWYGTAEQPQGLGVRPDTDGATEYLVLPTFGLSEARFPFRIEDAMCGHDRVLVTRFQRNARNYYPEMGQTVLEVTLNGAPLDVIRSVRVHATERAIDLPATALRVGENTIQVRILDASTSPLLIHGLRIVVLAPGGK